MINDELDHVLEWYSRTQKHCGLKHSVKVFKTARLHVTRFIAGHPIVQSDIRLSLTKDGLPRALGPLIPILRKREPADLRIILTLLNVSRLALGDGTLDLTSIESPRVVTNLNADWEARIVNHFNLNLSNFFDKLDVEWKQPHPSTKRGPNGQAIATSLVDLAILPEELRRSISILGGSLLHDYMLLLEPTRVLCQLTGKEILRRISVVKDKELKNRPIAIFDY